MTEQIYNDLEEDDYATYADWNKLGRRINSGEKAHRFHNGVAYFSHEQTYDPNDKAWLKTSSRFGITGPWDDAPH